MNSKDTLGDRIKENYEDAFRITLPKRIPVIMRIDGKNFTSYTKILKRPFDFNLISAMNKTALFLVENIQNARIAYVQSDEISILLNNFRSLETKSWFKNNLQKMVSIAAGLASSYFTSISNEIFDDKKIHIAQFDARAFVLPKEEVNNAFYWRQLDASRNSIQMMARSLYSHKDCNYKNQSQLQEMIFKKGHNWNDLSTGCKRGRCIIPKSETFEMINKKTGIKETFTRNKFIIDNEIPIFSQDKNYIGQYLNSDP